MPMWAPLPAVFEGDVLVPGSPGYDEGEGAQAACRRRRASTSSRGDDTSGPQAGATLYYGSVDEFIREYLRNVYRRRIDGRHRHSASRRMTASS